MDRIDHDSLPKLSDAVSLSGSRFVLSAEELPDSFDWREKNIVGPIKEQHSCGSCWAFTTASVLSSQYAKKTGQMVDLSEQFLIDCDNIDKGCKGGLMTDAYEYLQKT